MINKNNLEMLIAGMNCEVRSSMNIIVGVTDLMLEDNAVPAHVKNDIMKVNSAGRTLMRSISNILDTAMVGMGPFDFIPSQHDIEELEQKKLTRSDLSHAKALVVDDYVSSMDVAADMLRKYNMQVYCAAGGREAVDRVAAGAPVYDIIFMDYMMPEMDGMEATALIREIGTEYARNVPIIALTGNAVAGSEKIFLSNGFNAFLSKPICMTVLDSIIKRWVKAKL